MLLLLDLLVVTLAVPEQRSDVVHDLVVFLLFVYRLHALLPAAAEPAEIALEVFYLNRVSKKRKELLIERVVLLSCIAKQLFFGRLPGLLKQHSYFVLKFVMHVDLVQRLQEIMNRSRV